MQIRIIRAQDTWEIRQQVLRPTQNLSDVQFPNDDSPGARHFGSFKDGQLVGIASVCCELFPGELGAHAWRLRGMATLPEVRGQGRGKALIAACLAHVREQRATCFWCSARTSALSFYTALGFESWGEVYEVPEAGPHVQRRRTAPGTSVRGVMPLAHSDGRRGRDLNGRQGRAPSMTSKRTTSCARAPSV